MRIVISNASGSPIYEQIHDQIQAAIISGELAEGERLPSIRGLARDLRVSVITTTRAYADLAAEGFVDNVQGKGSFVATRDTTLVREHLLAEVETHLGRALDVARRAGLTDTDVRTSLDTLLDHTPLTGTDAAPEGETR